MDKYMNEFVQKLLDDIHNINPELALKRQTEYNQSFLNNELKKQCDIHVDMKSFFCNDGRSKDGKCLEQCGICSEYANR